VGKIWGKTGKGQNRKKDIKRYRKEREKKGEKKKVYEMETILTMPRVVVRRKRGTEPEKKGEKAKRVGGGVRKVRLDPGSALRKGRK